MWGVGRNGCPPLRTCNWAVRVAGPGATAGRRGVGAIGGRPDVMPVACLGLAEGWAPCSVRRLTPILVSLSRAVGGRWRRRPGLPRGGDPPGRQLALRTAGHPSDDRHAGCIGSDGAAASGRSGGQLQGWVGGVVAAQGASVAAGLGGCDCPSGTRGGARCVGGDARSQMLAPPIGASGPGAPNRPRTRLPVRTRVACRRAPADS